MSDEERWIPREFVYCGRRRSAAGKVLHCVRQVLEGSGGLGKEEFYDGKYSWTVGGVYSGAKFSEKGSRGLAGAGWARYLGGDEVLVWRALDGAVADDLRAERVERDSRRIDELAEALLPARRSYHAALVRHDMTLVWALERAVVRALKVPPKRED